MPHSANVKPSWTGESVGHYEGDTPVVDTIGINDKTYIDNFCTPHTKKLHVVERFRMIDDGNIWEANIGINFPAIIPLSAICTWKPRPLSRRSRNPDSLLFQNAPSRFDSHVKGRRTR